MSKVKQDVYRGEKRFITSHTYKESILPAELHLIYKKTTNQTFYKSIIREQHCVDLIKEPTVRVGTI